MEQLDLGAPFGALVGTQRWIVQDIVLHRGFSVSGTTITSVPAQSYIKVVFLGEYGHTKSHAWTGTGADADIVSLNKVNLSSTSLQKRIINKAVADGVLTGSVTGSPD